MALCRLERVWVAACAVMVVGAACDAQAQEAAAAGRMPVTRVVLYKNGVGYFEHVGRVRERQDVNIAFTSGQLNDALKSLTVLDLNGGRIRGVEYGSAAPAARQWEELRMPAAGATLVELLRALRGARVEIRNGPGVVVAGRLVSVDRKVRITGATTVEVDYVSLLAEGGEVKTTELATGFSVKLLEPGLGDKMGRYLDLSAADRQSDLRRMTVSTEGEGERSLFVSYISEAPVWKSTYRIVLSGGGAAQRQPLLQGWAIVDNTGAQDWNRVQMSLVAGAPQSFLQNLSQPLYVRRPVVPVAGSVNETPQTFEAAVWTGGAQLSGRVTDPSGIPLANVIVTAMAAGSSDIRQASTNMDGVYELSGLPAGSEVSLKFELAGFRHLTAAGIRIGGVPVRYNASLSLGDVAQQVNVTASAPMIEAQSTLAAGKGRRGMGAGVGGGVSTLPAAPTQAATADAIGAARAALDAKANAKSVGDLFEYKLKEPVTIARNRSALVPIVQASIAAEKVSVWNETSGRKRPQRALWIENTTGLTLDGGSFSVLDEETFAGEGIFEQIGPKEKRLVSYATDLAVTVASESGPRAEQVTRVRVSKGVMVHHVERQETKVYAFRNEDAAARTLLLEHPVRAGYQLRGDLKPVEVTAQWMRFRVPLGAKQTVVFPVAEVESRQASYALSNLGEADLDLFVQNGTVTDAALLAQLRAIQKQKAVVAEWEQKQERLEEEKKTIFSDQERLRANITALPENEGGRQLRERLTRQLSKQEDRLEALPKEVAAAEKGQEAAEEKLTAMIEAIEFDRPLQRR